VCKCVLPPGDNPIAVNKYIIYTYINRPEGRKKEKHMKYPGSLQINLTGAAEDLNNNAAFMAHGIS
jgi:hypothetical protein